MNEARQQSHLQARSKEIEQAKSNKHANAQTHQSSTASREKQARKQVSNQAMEQEIVLKLDARKNIYKLIYA